ncbi:single-stranded DNA-binding protein [uncultured Amnibacterium sp.]|uniref:single-stranded DNA-binding protein n=1 Tax=uncultured Amnibacterium sp. TaxID=1631851 RepID=UPI0035C9995B
MADNDNTITLIGRIGQEPELRSTSKGEVLNFTLATSERRRAADGSWADGPTSWFRVAAWNDLARNAHASFHRGQQVIVRGVLTVREFTLESGGKSRNAELRATALGHDLRWGTSDYRDGARPTTTAQQDQPAHPGSAQPAEPGDWGAQALAGLQEPQREAVPVGAAAGWSAEDETPF